METRMEERKEAMKLREEENKLEFTIAATTGQQL